MLDDEKEICKYGTPLEPLDEDELPRNKPPSIDEQYALDESGRRRFHGAFTGGFSAGFCNTVGSLEGWTPSTFKSSRKNKAGVRLQKPEDFMDSEDREEWGIAPKRLQTTSDYSETVSKKKRFIGPQGPIPGDPILYRLMKPPSDNVGVRLLKAMGWREGQGTGPRKHISRNVDNEQEDITMLGGLTFGPSDCENFEYIPKMDSFGMGYSGLDRNTFCKPFSLFEPSTLNIIDKNKKFSVQGQAFGTGAFEEEDEDIYHREDMSQYDFIIENEKKPKTPEKITPQRNLKLKCISGFVLSNALPYKLKLYPLPNVPKNYKPTCGRKTRFGPMLQDLETKALSDNYLKKGLGRHDLDPDKRKQIIEGIQIIPSLKEKTNYEEEKKILLHEASNITSKLGSVTTFKPFAADPEKEKRYNYFISLNKEDRIKKLMVMQPFGMTEWERDRECREFEQALRLYKPLQGLMSDRFISGGTADEKQIPNTNLQPEEEAAHKKMYGKLTRRVDSWKPVNLLCKRFNVPEPLGGCILLDDANKTSSSYSVFEYTETSVNRRKDYEHIEKGGISIPNQMPTMRNRTPDDSTITKPLEVVPLCDKVSLKTESRKVGNNVVSNKKTLLEKKIEQNITTNLVENKNLFKLIFVESSDSEEEDGVKSENKDSVDEMKSYLLKDDPKSKEIMKNSENEEQGNKSNNTAHGIFTNVNLEALKSVQKKNSMKAPNQDKTNLNQSQINLPSPEVIEPKILFQVPTKTKEVDLNTFSTVSSSSNKKEKEKNEENDLDSKILAYLEKSKKNKLSKHLTSKIKKSKKKHKLKEKKKKEKKKKSKKSKASKS